MYRVLSILRMASAPVVVMAIENRAQNDVHLELQWTGTEFGSINPMWPAHDTRLSGGGRDRGVRAIRYRRRRGR